MTGTKRSWEGSPVIDTATAAPVSEKNNIENKTQSSMDESSSQTLAIFGTFRDELDEHHDRRERITKTSRDITALSKKMWVCLSVGDRCIEALTTGHTAVSSPYNGPSLPTNQPTPPRRRRANLTENATQDPKDKSSHPCLDNERNSAPLRPNNNPFYLAHPRPHPAHKPLALPTPDQPRNPGIH